MKILSIDFGLKRIGFAVGSRLLQTASPIEALARKSSKQVIQHIKHLIEEYDITQILVGYPLNMDGTPGSITQHVEHFSTRLRKAVEPEIPVQWIDERLSSFEAGQQLSQLKQGSAKRKNKHKEKRKELLDSMSAVVILQRYYRAAPLSAESPSDHLTQADGAFGEQINGKEENI